MENLRITPIQSALHWESIDENLEQFSRTIASINKQTDIVVLPEMFTTGFTMNAVRLAEPVDGKTTQWMAQQAQKANVVVCGSIIVEEKGNYYNRMIWMRPDGSYEMYDKRHLFRMAAEQKTYTGGNEKLIVQHKGWKICPLICYDLRFPLWSRNKFNPAGVADYDVLLYVANWPERRSYHWKSLLVARAIENLSYVVGLNRVGDDGNNIPYSGDSVVLNYRGEPISTISPAVPGADTVALSYNELEEYRKNFPAWMDADDFKITT